MNAKFLRQRRCFMWLCRRSKLAASAGRRGQKHLWLSQLDLDALQHFQQPVTLRGLTLHYCAEWPKSRSSRIDLGERSGSAAARGSAQAHQLSHCCGKDPHLCLYISIFPKDQHSKLRPGLTQIQCTIAFHRVCMTPPNFEALLHRRSGTDTSIHPSHFRVRPRVIP